MANNDNIIYAKFNHGHEITTDPIVQKQINVLYGIDKW